MGGAVDETLGIGGGPRLEGGGRSAVNAARLGVICGVVGGLD